MQTMVLYFFLFVLFPVLNVEISTKANKHSETSYAVFVFNAPCFKGCKERKKPLQPTTIIETF